MAKVVDTTRLDKLVEENLFNVGEKRLEKFSRLELVYIARRLEIEFGDEATTETLQAAILLVKRRRQRAKAKTMTSTKEEKDTEEPRNNEIVDHAQENACRVIQKKERARQRSPAEAFVKRHEIRVMFFNSLKLRTTNTGLAAQWAAIVGVFASFDVLVVTEVPASEKNFLERTQALRAMLESHSEAKWTQAVSEPCGPGNAEVHIVYAKNPIEIVANTTIKKAGGTDLQRWPLVACIRDTRFQNGLTEFVLTGVHMPPADRRFDRDAQIKSLVSAYPTESALRLDRPFTLKGAKDARKAPVAHIVAGDFNTWPGAEEYGATRNGWTAALGAKVPTSVGGSAFDNFLFSSWLSDYCVVNSEILELTLLQNSRKGTIGVSDHSPILLRVSETGARV